jgi:chromosome segregation ATPase
MKEAKTRVRKSEIEYETFDRMELTTLLHVMVREERLAAVWRELAPKMKASEDLEYQHGAAKEEENKLKEDLRAANVRLNQAKNECAEADRELEKVRKEFDRLKENLDLSQIEYESQRKAKSIELLDAKDNLLKLKVLEISRRRKELLMERKELAASHPSAPLSINSQFSLPGEFFSIFLNLSE